MAKTPPADLHPALAPTDGPDFFPPPKEPQLGDVVSNVPSTNKPGEGVLAQSSVQHLAGTPGGVNPPTLAHPDRGASPEAMAAAEAEAKKAYDAELLKQHRVGLGRQSNVRLQQRGWLVVEPVAYGSAEGKRQNAKPGTVIDDLGDADITMFLKVGAIRPNMVPQD